MFQNTMLRKIRNENKIALIMIFSNTVFIFFIDNFIVYFRFKILFNANAMFLCDVFFRFNLVKFLTKIEFIFEDEIFI